MRALCCVCVRSSHSHVALAQSQLQLAEERASHYESLMRDRDARERATAELTRTPAQIMHDTRTQLESLQASLHPLLSSLDARISSMIDTTITHTPIRNAQLQRILSQIYSGAIHKNEDVLVEMIVDDIVCGCV